MTHTHQDLRTDSVAQVFLSNQELIDQFYRSFQQGDWQGMAGCYADDVLFCDEVFVNLQGREAQMMWRMLLERSQGQLEITYKVLDVSEREGRAYWEATYPFSKTGRIVHNKIHAHFRFRDGRIIEHRDSFSLHAWAGMALGPVGKLLGWLPAMRRKIQTETRGMLDAYMKKTLS